MAIGRDERHAGVTIGLCPPRLARPRLRGARRLAACNGRRRTVPPPRPKPRPGPPLPLHGPCRRLQPRFGPRNAVPGPPLTGRAPSTPRYSTPLALYLYAYNATVLPATRGSPLGVRTARLVVSPSPEPRFGVARPTAPAAPPKEDDERDDMTKTKPKPKPKPKRKQQPALVTGRHQGRWGDALLQDRVGCTDGTPGRDILAERRTGRGLSSFVKRCRAGVE